MEIKNPYTAEHPVPPSKFAGRKKGATNRLVYVLNM